MNQKFQAAVHQREEVTYVKLAGVIDEDNELTELSDKIPGGTTIINLGEIDRINSCGVRDWVNWLTRVEKNGARVVLVECSPAIVAQINLVNNFTGGGVVKSFFAPYFCPNCEREKVLLIEASELAHMTASGKAPTCRCDECDGVMDFDDMEDSYFAFLSTAKKVSDGARINAVVSEFNADTGEKSKIRSRVGSTGTGSMPSASSLGVSASSLPSVPSLPSMSRTNAGSTPGTFPGLSGTGSGQKSFTGGGTGPGHMNGSAATIAAPELASSKSHPAVEQPRSSKMVYLLVAVIIAAICVLAVLLFTGNKKTTSIDAPPSIDLPV
jgi:anti-anti-sigma regulatory factor